MPSIETLFPTAARLLRRMSGRPRRIAAAACAAMAALLMLSGASGAGEAEQVEPLAVAAREIPAGAVLDPADVRLARWPRSAVPSGALRTAEESLGRRVGAAMGAGEPLTAWRLADGGYGESLRPDTVAMIIAADAQALLARAGDRVDVYASNDALASEYPADAAGGADAGTRLIATGARVLAALPGSEADRDGQLVLEVDRAAITAVAAARDRRLTVVVTAPP